MIPEQDFSTSDWLWEHIEDTPIACPDCGEFLWNGEEWMQTCPRCDWHLSTTDEAAERAIAEMEAEQS